MFETLQLTIQDTFSMYCIYMYIPSADHEAQKNDLDKFTPSPPGGGKEQVLQLILFYWNALPFWEN